MERQVMIFCVLTFGLVGCGGGTSNHVETNADSDMHPGKAELPDAGIGDRDASSPQQSDAESSLVDAATAVLQDSGTGWVDAAAPDVISTGACNPVEMFIERSGAEPEGLQQFYDEFFFDSDEKHQQFGGEFAQPIVDTDGGFLGERIDLHDSQCNLVGIHILTDAGNLSAALVRIAYLDQFLGLPDGKLVEALGPDTFASLEVFEEMFCERYWYQFRSLSCSALDEADNRTGGVGAGDGSFSAGLGIAYVRGGADSDDRVYHVMEKPLTHGSWLKAGQVSVYLIRVEAWSYTYSYGSRADTQDASVAWFAHGAWSLSDD